MPEQALITRVILADRGGQDEYFRPFGPQDPHCPDPTFWGVPIPHLEPQAALIAGRIADAVLDGARPETDWSGYAEA